MPTTKKTTTTRRTTKARKTTPKADPSESLTRQFKELRMPTFRDQFQPMATRAQAEQMSHLDYLSELTTLECEVRRQGRIKRLMTRSKLPTGKTWESFDRTRLPMNVRRQLEAL
ncbi:MAG: ATP-binding protein [Planctomycetota bacterium]